MFAVLTYRRDWDEREFFATGEEEIAEVLAYTRGLGLRIGSDRALDFGCGLGRLTRPLGSHFREVVGVDVSHAMIERARALNRDHDRCRFVLNTEPDLALLADASFDFVYSNITLQHMPWELGRRYVQEFLRVARPDGTIVFQLPSGVREEQRDPPVRAVIRRARAALGVALRLGRRHMEMHCTPRPEVERAVAEAGGRVVDAKPDERGGRRWDGFRYTVVPRAHPSAEGGR